MSSTQEIVILDQIVAKIRHSGKLFDLVIAASNNLRDNDARREKPTVLSYPFTDAFVNVVKEFESVFLPQVCCLRSCFSS